MGMLSPMACSLPGLGPTAQDGRNAEAARPAIVLPKKDLLFMTSIMLVLRWGSTGLRFHHPWSDVGKSGEGRQRVSPRVIFDCSGMVGHRLMCFLLSSPR